MSNLYKTDITMPRDPEVPVVQLSLPVITLKLDETKRCDGCDGEVGERNVMCENNHNICEKCVKKLIWDCDEKKKKKIFCPVMKKCSGRFDVEMLREKFGHAKSQKKEISEKEKKIVPPFPDFNVNKNNNFGREENSDN
jgi:hypothetical protein